MTNIGAMHLTTNMGADDATAVKNASAVEMEDHAVARLAVDDVRAIVAQKLRGHFPYLKDAAINEILDKSSDTLHSMLVDQVPVMAATKSRSSFMSLSAELRNRIYELAIPRDQDLSLNTPLPVIRRSLVLQRTKKFMESSPRSKLISPAISKVSREIRAETLPIYFGNNRFHFEMDGWTRAQRLGSSYTKVHRWLKAIGPDAASMIRHAKLKVHIKEKEWNKFEPASLDKLRLLQAGISEQACSVDSILILDEDDEEA